MNTPWILPEYSANTPWIPLSLDPYGRSIPCKYHQAPYIPFHLSVFRFVSFVPFAVAITRGGIWFPNNFGSAKFLLRHVPCRGTMLVPRNCCLCCRSYSPFSVFRFHFSPLTWHLWLLSISLFCFAFASGLALVLVFLCPFPRMLFGYPRIDFNWQLNWRPLSLTNPWAPNVLFWAQ